MRQNIVSTVMYGDTRPVRFWMAILNLMYGTYLFNKVDPGITSQIELISSEYSPLIWCVLYTINAWFLLWGLKVPYTKVIFYFEGMLGWVLWAIAAVTNALVVGTPGPLVLCAIVMTWIIIRHPTQWKEDAYD
jgi:hypothetical protein